MLWATKRIVIVGMTNPLSRRPEHALFTRPEGCTGNRLWKMATARTGISEREWLQMTDRRNLCLGEWNRADARVSAREMLLEIENKTTILLGSEVALCFPSCGMLAQWHRGRATRPWIHLPHPSGRNHWYNDRGMQAGVEILLADLVHMCTTEDTSEESTDNRSGWLSRMEFIEGAEGAAP
jgi:hypothetical protein